MVTGDLTQGEGQVHLYLEMNSFSADFFVFFGVDLEAAAGAFRFSFFAGDFSETGLCPYMSKYPYIHSRQVQQ